MVRRLLGFVAPRQGSIERIGFVKLAEQGSTVLAYPAIRRAVKMVGAANVYFVVFQDNRFILDVMDVIPRENVITISTRSFFAFALGTARALLQLRRLELNAVIDLEFLSRFSAIFSFLTGAPARVGFHTFYGDGPYRGDLMTHRLLYNPHLHTSQTFESMVEALGHDPAVLPTFPYIPPLEQELARFLPSPEETVEIQSLLKRENPEIGTAPIILLNPNASDLLPLRRWPAERFVELAQRILAAFPDVSVVITGAPSEAVTAEALTRGINSPRVACLAGKTSLRQLLVLYHRAEILVTNDSGPAHFASMTPIHVISLFGPETPKLFAPRSPNTRALWAGIACSPCVNAYNNRQSPCRDNVCMQAITVDRVLAEVVDIRRLSARSAVFSKTALPVTV